MSLQRSSWSCAPQFGQVRSIFSGSGRGVLHVSVVMRLIVLLLLAEVFGEMPENGCRIRGTSLECGDAAGAAPAVAALHANDDVLVEEPALLQETHRGLRREFVRAELANADQIAQPFGLLRFRQFQERIQTMN